MLFYVPLESLKERYTMQWSAPKTGWLERRWIEAGIEYTRIDGEATVRDFIGKGVVLDAVSRSEFCFSQITKLLKLADEGKLTSDDVIYIDDFWTPGVEALPYLFDQIGIKPKIFAYLHAQSVDEFDFTHKMRHWMRPIETGYGIIYDGIFVASPFLKDLVVFGGIAPAEKVHLTGHPFNSEEVTERMPFTAEDGPWSMVRENKVVFSSRFDAEKDPVFFCDVIDHVQKKQPGKVRFVICTSSKELRSNIPAALWRLEESKKRNPDNVTVLEGLTKEEYYRELATAKIQFNCADQDFVPITLQEASVAGAWPLYPYFRSFPETFRWDYRFMYGKRDVEEASKKIISVILRKDLWTKPAIQERSWLHNRYDKSWERQAQHMGLLPGTPIEP